MQKISSRPKHWYTTVRKPKRKENIIIFIGRFSQLEQLKNQDLLVKVFKHFYRINKSWKLIIAGGVEVGASEYIKKIKKSIKNYPIEIVESPNFKEIIDLYRKAKFFWSAVGFGVDEEKFPKKVEHFGMSLVEAMAGGSVPIVYNAGGYKEIVKDGKNGYFWKNKKDLSKITESLILNKGNYKIISENAKEDSEKFSYENFALQVKKLLQK